MPMGAKFYLLCTESASLVSPAALSTPLAHSLPEWNDCRLTIGSIEDNIIKVSRHGNLSKVCLLFKSRSMLCLSIDWAPANIQLRHKFKHVTSSSVSEFKTTDAEAGHAYKTLKGSIYSSSPLSTRKSGEMCRHKKEGEEGGFGEKGSTSPRSQIPGTTFVICDIFSQIWSTCVRCITGEVRGGIPSPGTVPQRGPPSDLVASEDASLGSRPRSREGVNPQK